MTQSALAPAIPVLLVLAAAVAAAPDANPRPPAAVAGHEEIQDDIVRLAADGGEFSAIHRAPQAGAGRGGLILLHDQGTGADSREIIRPLRLGLADAGWDTLSVQLPSAYRREGHEAWHARAPLIQARLQAAMAWLNTHGNSRQVVIAIGDSAAIALEFAAAQAPAGLRGIVLVSAAAEPDSASLSALQQRKLPILDIFAERDRGRVVDAAAARLQAALEAGSDYYRQRAVLGATAGFPGLDDSLVASIRAWLSANTDPQPPG